MTKRQSNCGRKNLIFFFSRKNRPCRQTQWGEWGQFTRLSGTVTGIWIYIGTRLEYQTGVRIKFTFLFFILLWIHLPRVGCGQSFPLNICIRSHFFLVFFILNSFFSRLLCNVVFQGQKNINMTSCRVLLSSLTTPIQTKLR